MKIINNQNEIIKSAKSFFADISNEIYILGTNKYGLSMLKWLEGKNYSVKGFINDELNTDTFEGYKIVRSENNFLGSSIINCIIEGRTIDAYNNIIQLSPKNFIDYFALELAFPYELCPVDYLCNTDLIIEKIKSYKTIYSKLEDSESKETFSNIINFRYNRDINYLKKFTFRLDKQYFEDFVMNDNIEYFVDGGGFDGQTTLNFINRNAQYLRIYYFEPEPEFFKLSQDTLKRYRNIEYINKGLWSESKKIKFDNSLGAASKIDKNGIIEVDLTSLDETLNGKTDFIKLDIEGAEFEALTGAEQIIKKYKPKIAVCVYHNQNDFIRIPDLLLNYNSSYKVYLRHYTQGIFETVMYFI